MIHLFKGLVLLRGEDIVQGLMKIRLLWRKYNGAGRDETLTASSSSCKYYSSSKNSFKNNGNNKLSRKDLTLSLEQKKCYSWYIISRRIFGKKEA